MENEFEIIDKYFDGECSKEEEVILFTKLSQNAGAREYFKNMNRLKEAAGSAAEDFPSELDEKILTLAGNKNRNEKSSSKIYGRIVYYAAAALVLVVVSWGYGEISSYKSDLDATASKIRQQEKLIKLMLNSSLPAAEVKSRYANEVVVIPEL